MQYSLYLKRLKINWLICKSKFIQNKHFVLFRDFYFYFSNISLNTIYLSIVYFRYHEQFEKYELGVLENQTEMLKISLVQIIEQYEYEIKKFQGNLKNSLNEVRLI